LKFIITPIYWILWPHIKLFQKIPFVQVLRVSFEIEKLERQQMYAEARKLRHKWLAKKRYSNSEILLCSEGKDLLYNKKEYERAFQLFENVIEIDPYYNPIELYYGASCAALLTGDFQKAKEYYLKLQEWWDKFEKDPKLKNHLLRRFASCKDWLEGAIKSGNIPVS